jgi:hypothetical protein
MKNFAHLKPECPFYDLFAPHGFCPIINIMIPSQVELEGSNETEVYMVDLVKVGDERLSEIARRIAQKAGAPPMTVFREIKERGLPLRVSQTDGCSTDVPFFL